MFSNFLAVGAGGAIGAMGRYAVGLIPALQRGAFPLHTLLINLGGAILIGMAAASAQRWTDLSPTLLLFWQVETAKAEDPAIAWGKAHGLLTDANAGDTVTREQLVRALYKLEGGHG